MVVKKKIWGKNSCCELNLTSIDILFSGVSVQLKRLNIWQNAKDFFQLGFKQPGIWSVKKMDQ